MKKTIRSIRALAISAVMAVAFTVSAGEVQMGTGGNGGGYHTAGVKVAEEVFKASRSKTTVKLNVDTGGSLVNIEDFNEGLVDMILAQSDALMYNRPTRGFKAKKGPNEYIFWFHATGSSYTSLEDLRANEEVRIVLVGGAESTMQSFQAEDSGYKDNIFLHTDDLEDALEYLAEGLDDDDNKVGGVLYVGAKLPSGLAAEYASVVSVGQAEDSDFNDAEDVNGDDLYTFCSIPQAAMFGFHSDAWGEPDTLCMNAMIVYAKDIENFSKVRKGVRKAVARMK